MVDLLRLIRRAGLDAAAVETEYDVRSFREMREDVDLMRRFQVCTFQPSASARERRELLTVRIDPLRPRPIL